MLYGSWAVTQNRFYTIVLHLLIIMKRKPIQLNRTALGRQHVWNGHFSNGWKLLSSTKRSYLSWVREIFSGCWFREQWKKHQFFLLCNLWAFLCGELSGNQALASSMIRMSKWEWKGESVHGSVNENEWARGHVKITEEEEPPFGNSDTLLNTLIEMFS